MRHIFVVDDEMCKMGDVTTTLHDLYPEAAVSCFYWGNGLLRELSEYKDMISKNPNDYLVVTDMQIPMYQYSNIYTECGYLVIARMHLIDVKCPAIIVSSGSVDDTRAKENYEYYAGSILYQDDIKQTNEYKELIDKFLEEHKQ